MILSNDEYRILGTLQNKDHKNQFIKPIPYKQDSNGSLQQLRELNTNHGQPLFASLKDTLMYPFSQLIFEINHVFGLERESDSKRQERASFYKSALTGTLICAIAIAAISTSSKACHQAPTIEELLAMHK